MPPKAQRPRYRHPAAVTALFLVVAFWLIASPYVLGFAAVAAAWWNAVVGGVALLLLGLLRLSSREYFDKFRWTALLLGAWIVASPFVAGYSMVSTAMWNAVVVGAVVMIAAISAAAEPFQQRA